MTSSQTVRERPKSTRPRPAAGTPPRSTRPTNSTRSTRPPSTRPSTRATTGSSSIEGTAKASTRKPRAVGAEAPQKSSAPRRMIRTEAVPQGAQTPVKPGKKSTRNAVASNAPRVGKSTRNVIRTEPGQVTRTEVFTEKREQARFIAPAQFLLVMFGVVIVSVFAFGLLKGDSEQTLPEKPEAGEVIKFEPSSTSTNTGILRSGGKGE